MVPYFKFSLYCESWLIFKYLIFLLNKKGDILIISTLGAIALRMIISLKKY